MTFLHLYQPTVQNWTATTRPRRASVVSGALLIPLPAVISGAAVPGAGWAAVPPAPANVSSVTASVRRARRRIMQSSPRIYVDSRTGGWPEPRGRVAAMAGWCSIVIPPRNDAAPLALTLDALDRLEERSRAEIVVAACGHPARTEHAAPGKVPLLLPES